MILDFTQFERIVEKMKKEKIDMMIQELFNSTVNEVVSNAIRGKINVELIVAMSVTFSVSLTILIAIHTCCIAVIWEKEPSHWHQEGGEKEEGERVYKAT